MLRLGDILLLNITSRNAALTTAVHTADTLQYAGDDCSPHLPLLVYFACLPHPVNSVVHINQVDMLPSWRSLATLPPMFV